MSNEIVVSLGTFVLVAVGVFWILGELAAIREQLDKPAAPPSPPPPNRTTRDD
jgi:hypothetical protein